VVWVVCLEKCLVYHMKQLEIRANQNGQSHCALWPKRGNETLGKARCSVVKHTVCRSTNLEGTRNTFTHWRTTPREQLKRTPSLSHSTRNLYNHSHHHQNNSIASPTTITQHPSHTSQSANQPTNQPISPKTTSLHKPKYSTPKNVPPRLLSLQPLHPPPHKPNPLQTLPLLQRAPRLPKPQRPAAHPHREPRGGLRGVRGEPAAGFWEGAGDEGCGWEGVGL